MKRFLKTSLLALLMGLALLYAGLGFLPASGRLVVYFLAQLVLPLIAICVIIGGAIVMAARRRANSRFIWSLMAGSAALAVLPFLRSILGLTYPSKIESTHPHLVMQLPFDQPAKVAWGGDAARHNYHAAYPDQRWAYDLAPEPGGVQTEALEDYGCYGASIFAPVSGEVMAAVDGDKDQVPNRPAKDYLSIFGNHIILRPEGFSGGERLVLAHLKPGSVAVKAGEQVSIGQAIALCGNSGNSSEPHLHIHFMNTLRGEIEFGYGLPLFIDHAGKDADMPLGGARLKDGKVLWTGAIISPKGR